MSFSAGLLNWAPLSSDFWGSKHITIIMNDNDPSNHYNDGGNTFNNFKWSTLLVTVLVTKYSLLLYHAAVCRRCPTLNSIKNFAKSQFEQKDKRTGDGNLLNCCYTILPSPLISFSDLKELMPANAAINGIFGSSVKRQKSGWPRTREQWTDEDPLVLG